MPGGPSAPGLAPEPDPKAEPVVPVLPVEPLEPMPGHGCPDLEPGPGAPGAGAPRGAVDPFGACADVVAVVWVVVVPLEDAGAAAETAMPPSAPAEASVPVITATLIAFEDIIVQ